MVSFRLPLLVLAVGAALSMLVSVDAQYEQYGKFQALGFGIYTGGAIFCTNKGGNCTDVDDCPSGRNVEVEGELYCLDYVNKECKCNENGCQMAIGHDGTSTLECYLGMEDTQADVEGRLSIMIAAVERAYRAALLDSSILKIFHAPEFFFRGPDGGYDLNDPAVYEIVLALTGYVAQQRFKDWLFILGTIVTFEQIPDSPNYEYQNFALVLRGYDPLKSNGKAKRFVVPKRYIGPVDFLSRTDAAKVPTTAKSASYPAAVLKSVKSSFRNIYKFVIVENNWVVIDDLLFSFEICLDHSDQQALFSSTSLFAARGKYKIPIACGGALTHGDLPSNLAQISIITSAGISIQTGSLVPTTRGSVFLQDGIQPNAPQLWRCWIEKKQDGTLGWNKFCDNEFQAVDRPTMPYRKYRVYKTLQEAAQAMRELFSLYAKPQPIVHVFKPVPIEMLTSVCASTKSNKNSNRKQNRRKGSNRV